MRLLNFRKTVPRTHFATIFGSVGKRKSILCKNFGVKHKRTKMQMFRRAKQGWRNKRIGSIQALKIRLKYGRRKTISPWR